LSQASDKNTRGIGLVLRFSAVALPTVLFFVLFLLAEHASTGLPASTAGRVFQVPAFLWAWPYGMFREHPYSFGALGLAAICMSGLLALRRDSRGWITASNYSFAFGWIVATIVGQAQGS
jgi:hypothetical protein